MLSDSSGNTRSHKNVGGIYSKRLDDPFDWVLKGKLNDWNYRPSTTKGNRDTQTVLRSVCFVFCLPLFVLTHADLNCRMGGGGIKSPRFSLASFGSKPPRRN